MRESIMGPKSGPGAPGEIERIKMSEFNRDECKWILSKQTGKALRKITIEERTEDGFRVKIWNEIQPESLGLQDPEKRTPNTNSNGRFDDPMPWRKTLKEAFNDAEYEFNRSKDEGFQSVPKENEGCPI
jgi:hypothetical protein